MSFLNFDINEYKTKAYEPIPEGDYTVQANNAEIKHTKAGTGRYISVTLVVLGPTHQGRSIFVNFNIENDNPKAEEIGRRQFSDFLFACDFNKSPEDLSQLVGLSCDVKIGVKENNFTGDFDNVVKKYISKDATKTSAAYQAGAQAAAQSNVPDFLRR